MPCILHCGRYSTEKEYDVGIWMFESRTKCDQQNVACGEAEKIRGNLLKLGTKASRSVMLKLFLLCHDFLSSLDKSIESWQGSSSCLLPHLTVLIAQSEMDDARF